MTPITNLCMLNYKTDKFVSSQRRDTFNLTHITQIIPSLGGLEDMARYAGLLLAPSAEAFFASKKIHKNLKN